MKQCGGNVKAAFDLLKEHGLAPGSDRKWLDRVLLKCPSLKTVWIDNTSSYSLIEAPGIMSPKDQHALEIEMAGKEQDFIDARNIDELFGADAGEINKLAQFAEQSFSKSINITHATMVMSSHKLSKRAQWIEENVLQYIDDPDNLYEHTVVTEDGTVVKYEGPKYSEDDKLEWQKQYTTIMAELRKFAETGNNAALARIKAAEIAGKMGGGGGDGRATKSTRGGRILKG
jgi:hypothetical protein